MKRLTLIILGVLLCTPLYSDMNTYVIGSGGGGFAITEDFSDCSDWTTIGDHAISCSGGAADGVDWFISISRHNTPTGSNDHWVAATCSIHSNGYDSATLILGSNGTDWYESYFEGGTFYIRSGNQNWSCNYAGSYSSGSHTVAIQIDTDGSGHARFNAWIDGVQSITNESDTGDNVTRGQYVGVRIDKNGTKDDVTIDDLIADAGSYTP